MTLARRIRLPVLLTILAALVAYSAYRALRPRQWLLAGVAATSRLNHAGHRLTREGVMRGARSLASYKTVLFNHDQSKPVGRLLRARVVDGASYSALHVLIEIDPSRAELWRQVRRGLVTGLSVAVSPLETHPDINAYGDEITIITRCSIMEISVVTVPADSVCRITRSRGIAVPLDWWP